MSNQQERMQRVFPMIAYEDVASAADWMAEAFGFRETGRWADSDGRVTQLEMEIGGASIMLGFPSPEYQSPRHHAEDCERARAWLATPYIVDGVLVYVDDVDAHFNRAEASGATVLSPLKDNPEIGQRSYRVEDAEGHRWMFAQPT
jgi:uncharacterized glyoxalase superfamily protein PhnB